MQRARVVIALNATAIVFCTARCAIALANGDGTTAAIVLTAAAGCGTILAKAGTGPAAWGCPATCLAGLVLF